MGVWWNVDTPDLESGTSNGVRVRVSPSPQTLLSEKNYSDAIYQGLSVTS